MNLLSSAVPDNYLFEAFNCWFGGCHGCVCHHGCTRFFFYFAVCLLAVSVIIFLRRVILPVAEMVFRRSHDPILKKRAFQGWTMSTVLAGWFIYMVGFCHEGTSQSCTALLFRPLFSSLEQFVFHSSLIEVSPCCHESSWYMGAYTVIFGCAMLISSLVMVNCLGNRFFFWLKRRWWLRRRCGRTDIFFGVNDKSLCLAGSILAKEKSRIVFVNFPDEHGPESVRSSLSRIFGMNSFDEKEASVIRKYGGIIINASSALFDDKNYGEKNEYVLEENGMNGLAGLIKKARQVRMFFLSEDENRNVRAAINVEQSHAIHKKQVDIYCKGRKNYENLTLTDYSTNATFHLVDDSACAVNALKMMETENCRYVAHPVNYVRVDSSLGTVESKFTCLIAGFGQTGQDALRFFYEFSAFTGRDGRKSPVHFRAVDRRMDSLLGYVRCEMPALKTDPSSSGVIPEEEIELRNMDYHSAEFWKMLEEPEADTGRPFINDLNCVVVAVGNDEENISLASQIYEFALRHDAVGGKPGCALRIFVRAYNPEEEARLRKVEEYYGKESDVIKVFGMLNDIYSYDVIVENRIQKDAESFLAAYNSATGDNQSWAERHELLKTGTPGKRIEIRHKEQQDCANSLHQYTKLKLLGITSPSLPVRPMPAGYPFISGDDLKSIMDGTYSFRNDGDMETMMWYARLQNVSQCEHLRWNAAHYMLGFIRCGEDKDFRLRRHRCLVDWDQTETDGKTGAVRPLLPDSIKYYDYKVVEATVNRRL